MKRIRWSESATSDDVSHAVFERMATPLVQILGVLSEAKCAEFDSTLDVKLTSGEKLVYRVRIERVKRGRHADRSN